MVRNKVILFVSVTGGGKLMVDFSEIAKRQCAEKKKPLLVCGMCIFYDQIRVRILLSDLNCAVWPDFSMVELLIAMSYVQSHDVSGTAFDVSIHKMSQML